MALSLLDMDRLDTVDTATENKNQGDDGTWTFLHVLLPLAALSILWGQQGFITQFFLQFKENCISVLCPSINSHPVYLKWVNCRSKTTWFSQIKPLEGCTKDYWKNGSLLCFLINTAIPGACCNPQRHCNERPAHGQTLAYKYLGVSPIFTQSDLTDEHLSAIKEHKLLQYLLEVQKLVHKIAQREIKFSSRYLARGMGLITGEQFKKSTFYIYSNNSMINKCDVIISICGPFGSHCTTTVPARCVKKQTEKQQLDYVSKAQRLFFRSFSIDFGSVVDSEHTSMLGNSIPIKIITEAERLKVVFIPQTAGMHEISIVTNGYHLIGSPFLANIASKSKYLNETLNTNEDIPVQIINYKRIKKKIISKIIDCIDEQINLCDTDSDIFNENKIRESDDVASHFSTNPITREAHIEFWASGNTAVEQSEVSNSTTIINRSQYPSKKLEQAQSTSDFNLFQDISQGEISSEGSQIIEAKDSNYFLTSPICERNIDHEVNRKTGISTEITKSRTKKTLQRQHGVDTAKKQFQTEPELNCQDIDEQFEALLENTMEKYRTNSPYTDSYITELEPQQELVKIPSKRVANACFLNQWDLDKQYVRKHIPTIRRSLPNILTTTYCTDFRNKFNARQHYWKKLTNRTLSCSSVTSDQYIYSAGFDRTNTETIRSLPDLSDLRERILTESNYSSDFPTDFYSSHEAFDFRSKFLQYKSYWEILSHQSGSVEVISENDIDSGYFASLSDIQSEYKFFQEFKQRRQFWEQLSVDSRKLAQQQHEWRIRDKKETQLVGPHSVRIASPKHIVDTTINQEKAKIFNGMELGNLTDDLKQVDHLRNQYSKARSFFKSLEEVEKPNKLKFGHS